MARLLIPPLARSHRYTLVPPWERLRADDERRLKASDELLRSQLPPAI
ncbi:MAG TPA: hypothetical protein VGC35_11235 [Allosphingosinicella sp.]|jgi:hypothetical protein